MSEQTIEKFGFVKLQNKIIETVYMAFECSKFNYLFNLLRRFFFYFNFFLFFHFLPTFYFHFCITILTFS